MNISFDNTSLTTAPYIVNAIDIEGISNRQLFTYGLARQRGSQLLNTEYKAKSFKLSGYITADTAGDLDDAIDTFKELITRESKNLDISYGSGTRRYVCTLASIPELKREFYHITHIPFQIEFLAPTGTGTDTGETSETEAGINTLVNTDAIVVAGTVAPKMRTTFTFTAASALTKIEFLANGDKITVTTAIAAADIIIIDEASLKVTKNGVEIPYTGIFPAFTLGSNSHTTTLTGTSGTYTRKMDYTKTYL